MRFRATKVYRGRTGHTSNCAGAEAGPGRGHRPSPATRGPASARRPHTRERPGDTSAPAFLKKALGDADDDTEKRYVLGLIREDLYLALVRHCRATGPKTADPDGSKAWALADGLSRLDAAYAEGRYDEAVRILDRIHR